MQDRSNSSRKDNPASNKESRLTVENLTYLEQKLQNEVAVLKLQVQEQTKQIYGLYKRIAELNEIHKRRDREQQENIQECDS